MGVEIEIVGGEDGLVTIQQHIPVQTRRLEHALRTTVRLRGAIQHPEVIDRYTHQICFVIDFN